MSTSGPTTSRAVSGPGLASIRPPILDILSGRPMGEASYSRRTEKDTSIFIGKRPTVQARRNRSTRTISTNIPRNKIVYLWWLAT